MFINGENPDGTNTKKAKLGSYVDAEDFVQYFRDNTHCNMLLFPVGERVGVAVGVGVGVGGKGPSGAAQPLPRASRLYSHSRRP